MKSADEQDLVRAVKKHWRGAFHTALDWPDGLHSCDRAISFFLAIFLVSISMGEREFSSLKLNRINFIFNICLVSYSDTLNNTYSDIQVLWSVFNRSQNANPFICRDHMVIIISELCYLHGDVLKIRVALGSIQLFMLLERKLSLSWFIFISN